MKIQRNISVFGGTDPHSRAIQEDAKREKKSFFVGKLGEEGALRDRIAARKKEAQQKAMKIVGDVWNSDREVDMDLQKRRDHIERLRQENLDLQEQIRDMEDKEKSLDERYGITENKDSFQKAVTSGMTKEELEAYQEQKKELKEVKDYYQKQADENKSLIQEENAVIRAVRQERLKKDPMVKARQQAEAIREAASEEIIGMVTEDSREQIEKEKEEREKEAEKLKEQRKEQEKLLESKKKEEREWEEFLEDLSSGEILEIGQDDVDLQKEIQNILRKMKLIAEDIKGAGVDESI